MTKKVLVKHDLEWDLTNLQHQNYHFLKMLQSCMCPDLYSLDQEAMYDLRQIREIRENLSVEFAHIERLIKMFLNDFEVTNDG